MNEELSKKKCAWFMHSTCVACNKNSLTNSDYCKTHDYVESYDEYKKNNKKYCTGCRKVKYIPDGMDTCGCGNERIAKANAKRAEKNKEKAEERSKLERERDAERQRLVLDQNYKICNTCGEAKPQDSYIGVRKDITENCEICRTKFAAQDNKKTVVRNWHDEYGKNPELYDKKLENNRNRNKK